MAGDATRGVQGPGRGDDIPIRSVVVPVLQDVAVLQAFFGSLDATIELPSRLVLIDDGCTADARTLLENAQRILTSSKLVDIRYIRHEFPIGAGASLNEAVDACDTELVYVLDSDLILLPGWQSVLEMQLHELDRAVAVAGMLLYPQTGGVNHRGIVFYGDVGRHLNLNADPSLLPSDPFRVQTMGIAFTLLRRSAWMAAGGMKPEFHNGYEDLDLFMRMRAAGGEIYVAPQTVAYHWERSNGPHRAAGRKGNLARFWSRWHDHLHSDLFDWLEPILSGLIAGQVISDLVCLDLCSDRAGAVQFWRDFASKIGSPGHVRNLSHRVNDTDPAWLPIVAGADSDRDPRRHLLLVDNFVRLRGNHYWITRRSLVRTDDIVVDLSGNVMPLAVLGPVAWPGEKLR